MQELLTEGYFKFLDIGINKVQCLEREIKMVNIRNRDKKNVENTLDALFASYNSFNTDVRM